MTNSIWGRLRSVPSPSSKPIEIVWNAALRDRGREAIGGADLRGRVIHLHPWLRRRRAERERILAHELSHFAWLRAGNPRRQSWKELLQNELARGARGEMGWSAEWRKGQLPAGFAEYACEAFCDTGAWILTGCIAHPEVTMAERWRDRRRAWFGAEMPLPWRV